MPEFIELAKEMGPHVAALVFLAWGLWKMHNQVVDVLKEDLGNRKDQIDRLAEDNNIYRRIFLKKNMGMTDEELGDIFPGYTSPKPIDKKGGES